MACASDGIMRAMGMAHWDDIEPFDVDIGEMRSTWRNLGSAAGSVNVGCRRMVVQPGARTTPAHVHHAEEEISYVLGGTGLSWQDGETFEVRAGDALLHRADAEAHTLIAGDEGIDVVAFGTRAPTEVGVLPRAGVAWLGDGQAWTDVGGAHPFAREAAAGPLELPDAPSPRPDRIVALADVEPDLTERRRARFTEREFGRALGSVRSTLAHMTIGAGYEGFPPHCHSLDEEFFVVLEGAGVVVLGDEEIPLQPGTIVDRPPSTKVAHSFRASDAADLVYLVYGDLPPNDICFYPRSGKISFRGVGVMGRIEPLEYWEGEE
jgi:uncharacterized cupin superfamily protein